MGYASYQVISYGSYQATNCGSFQATNFGSFLTTNYESFLIISSLILELYFYPFLTFGMVIDSK